LHDSNIFLRSLFKRLGLQVHRFAAHRFTFWPHLKSFQSSLWLIQARMWFHFILNYPACSVRCPAPDGYKLRCTSRAPPSGALM
jgi:hypothetical protein